jgi:hypothetical protein
VSNLATVNAIDPSSNPVSDQSNENTPFVVYLNGVPFVIPTLNFYGVLLMLGAIIIFVSRRKMLKGF